MIARPKRLERLRQRQRDTARAVAVRAVAGATEAEAAIVRAQDHWLATATAGPTIAELEHATLAIDGAHAHARRCDEVVLLERARALTAARAWQRADTALTKARALHRSLIAAIEAREHDELAARRKR